MKDIDIKDYERKAKYIDSFPSRTMCAVLAEMRVCCKTSNYSYLPSLIEEVQSMGNRMEAALERNKEIRDAKEIQKSVKEDIEYLKKLKEEVEKNNDKA